MPMHPVRHLQRRILMVLLPLVGAASVVAAQPSGGPYGPVSRTYAVPAGAPHVYYVAPDGKPEASGTTLAEPTTLASAIERVVTGDVVVLRGGTYRTGGLRLNQGITLQPHAAERPVLKGTQIATEWRRLRDNVWRTSWKTLFPAAPLGWWQRDREGMRTPLHRFNNDMVFVDGKLLKSVGWEGELDENSYFIDYAKGQVYLGLDPANRLVEITAFDSALVRTTQPVHGKTNDRKGPVIRGITFTQYAYRALEVEGKRSFTAAEEPTDEPLGPADPATYGKEVTGTLIEDVAVTFCSRVGGYFRGDGLVIRNSLFSDTSTEGIYVIGSSDVLLERNIVRRNNVEQLTGYYPAAVKIFNQSHRVTCRDNLVLDNPHSNGIWYDVGNRDGVFVNNWIQDTGIGFFFEISSGATVAGNVFLRCARGLWSLNSAGVRAYHNTFVDAVASFDRNERSGQADHFGWHPKTGPDVDQRDGHAFAGNLMVASESFRGPLLSFEQPQSLCSRLTKPQSTQVNGNVYVRPATSAAPLVVWSPVAGESCRAEVGSLEDLRRLQPELETRGQALQGDPAAVFRSPELANYELAQLPAGLQLRDELPAEVARLLGWPAGEARAPGAYPWRAPGGAKGRTPKK